MSKSALRNLSTVSFLFSFNKLLIFRHSLVAASKLTVQNVRITVLFPTFCGCGAWTGGSIDIR
jgi:hypothetical protein